MVLPILNFGLRRKVSHIGMSASRTARLVLNGALLFGGTLLVRADARAFPTGFVGEYSSFQWAIEFLRRSLPRSVLGHQGDGDIWQIPRTFWNEHPYISIAVIAAVMVQGSLITGLLIQRRQRMRSESALRISEERYREVVESQAEMVCRFRADTTLTFVNAAYCKFFGKGRHELLGVSFLTLIPKERHPTIIEMINKVAAYRRPVVNEHEVIRPDGSIGWMEWEDFVVLNDRGEIEEFQGIGRDTTERRRAIDARIEAERNLVHATQLAQLGELTASIAHEINQPLGAILSNAEAAEMLLDSGSKEELRAILADIRKDDLRASEVIQHVRDLACKRQVSAEPVEMNKRVESVVRLLASDAQRRGVTLVTNLCPDLPVIQGDRVQIEQILLNLMLNGMEAMRDTPADRRRLVVGTRLCGAKVLEITISDGGRGIPTDKLTRIFDSFFTTKENGLGLGLALARSIAELHRGHVTAENNPEGGATFRLRLPVNAVPIHANML